MNEVFLDATDWHFLPEQTNPIPPIELTDYYHIPESTPNQIWRVTIKRHNKGINASFLDGGVRYLDLWELWDLNWHRGFIKQKYQRRDFGWL